MYTLLKTTVLEPIPSDAIQERHQQQLDADCIQQLKTRHRSSFDSIQGGLLSPVKFIDRDSVEYSLLLASEHDRRESEMAKLTLTHATALLDPVWGGMYQYSTQSCWNRPHYRKTMSTQAGNLRLYTLAYALYQHRPYLRVAQRIVDYIQQYLLSPRQTFYKGQTDIVAGIDSSQYFSLQDNERQQYGIPDIDKRITTHDNGWAIEALATFHEYCHNPPSLALAKQAMQQIKQDCYTTNHGWKADSLATQSLYLTDNVAMARAALQLYRVTLIDDYLNMACQTMDYIQKQFRHQESGFTTLINCSHQKTTPRQIDENIALGRAANLLFHYCSSNKYQHMAEHVMRYLSIREVATSRIEEAGILLLDNEMRNKPITFYFRGNRLLLNDSPLFRLILTFPGWYKTIRFIESTEESVVMKIDGILSRTLSSPEQLSRCLAVSAHSREKFDQRKV